jgi:predicted SnoaL-like aldol condensation-catalyzing enzyme
MASEHPNISVLEKFDPTDISKTAEVLAKDAVFHFFNPRLLDLQGDYIGLEGIQSFFQTMGQLTNGTFKVNPISRTIVGKELVVVQTRNTMVLGDEEIETDVVVVFRIVDGLISEIWDIPSVYS